MWMSCMPIVSYIYALKGIRISSVGNIANKLV